MGKVSIPYVGPKAEAVLLWKDPKVSGICFGGSTLIYILLGFTSLSPTALVCKLLAVCIATTWLWSTAGAFFGRTGPPVPPLLEQGVSEEQAKALVEKARVPLNKILAVLAQLVSGRDTVLSLKAGSALFVFGWLVSNVSLLNLAYTVLLLSFTVPKVYELKQKEIDQAVALAVGKVKEVYGKVEAVVLKKMPQSAAKKAQ